MRGWQDSLSVCETFGNEKWSSNGESVELSVFAYTAWYWDHQYQTYCLLYCLDSCCSSSCTALYIDFVKGLNMCQKKKKRGNLKMWLVSRLPKNLHKWSCNLYHLKNTIAFHSLNNVWDTLLLSIVWGHIWDKRVPHI